MKNASACHRGYFSIAGLENLEGRRFLSAGQLDPTFGVGGKAQQTTFSGAANMISQPDGKVLEIGRANPQQNVFVYEVGRLNANGTLDTAFGTNGRFSENPVTSTGAPESPTNLALQSDGRFLIGLNGSGKIQVQRFLPNGQIDLGFGVNGIASAPSSVLLNTGAVKVAADGKIVAVGGMTSNDGFATLLGIAIARFNPDGTPDATFGTGGVVLDTSTPGVSATNAVISAAGDITVIGDVVHPHQIDGYRIIRYSALGVRDTGATFSVPANVSRLVAITMQSDGRVVAVGNTSFGANSIILRYTTAGLPDPTFAHNGVLEETAIAPFSQVGYSSVYIQPDGKIVAGGLAIQPTITLESHPLISVYNSNGTPDTAFGTAGRVVSTFGGTNEYLGSIAPGPFGTVLEAGGVFGFGGLEALRLTGDSIDPGTAVISGSVFSDTNANGIHESNETGAASQQVYLDTANAGNYTPGDVITSTNAQGLFAFTGLRAATYFVGIVPDAGASVTSPDTKLFTVNLLPTQPVRGYEFGVAPAGSAVGTISGSIFNDTNINGIHNFGESGFVGQKVYIDTAHHGVFTPGDAVLTTDANGWFTFPKLPVGKYFVGLVPDLGITTTSPGSQFFTVDLAAGQKAVGYDFGAVSTASIGTISGAVYLDGNAIGHHDVNEGGLGGVGVFLDTAHYGVYTPGDTILTSDSKGWFTFGNLPTGNYFVGLVPDARLSVTSPAAKLFSVNLISGQKAVGNNFCAIGNPRILQNGKRIAASFALGSVGVSRYNPDGSIDSTFGNVVGAIGFTDVSANAYRPAIAAISLQPNGNISVLWTEMGSAGNPQLYNHTTILDPNGVLLSYV